MTNTPAETTDPGAGVANNRRAGDAAGSREIVSFRLADQDFCIDIMDIREIRGWTPPTPLPNAPDYVRGLINLRGSVLPIVDLSKRLGLASAHATTRDVIIVAMMGANLIGLVVDGVSDILTVNESDIQPTPALGSDSEIPATSRTRAAMRRNSLGPIVASRPAPVRGPGAGSVSVTRLPRIWSGRSA